MNLSIKLGAFLFFNLLLACSPRVEEDSVKLKQFVESKGYDYEVFRSILVITEYGCPQCNKSFAGLMSQQQENPQMLYIVAARGTIVDISELFDFKNLIKDFGNEFKSLNLTDKSSCIFLTEQGTIDTLVKIEARNLKGSLDYISTRLNN